MPAPFLVRPPVPLMDPPKLTALSFVSITPVLVRVTRRVEGEVIDPAACKVPPEKMSVLVALPLPRATLELAFRIPAAMVVVPE